MTDSKCVCYERTCITGDNYEQHQNLAQTNDSERYVLMFRSVFRSKNFGKKNHIAGLFSEVSISYCHGCNVQ